MCCAITILLLFGPRAAALAWSLLEPARWQIAFESLILPCLGIIFLPWTVLAYVLVAPEGVSGLDGVWLVLAFLIDIGSISGGAYNSRERIRRDPSRA